MKDLLYMAVCLMTCILVVYGVVTERWEYRAVYYYDCASYLTES